jgi:thiol:disulfide interchange protein DsbD
VASRTHGTRRSFFEGLLAVVLATPCSAPFLGTAVGFAFAGSPVTIVGVFLAIGFGLALPYLLITWVPAWSRFMPRSGPWMLTLRAGLGFALLATVVWLLYIAGGLAGIVGITALLALLVAFAFALFVFGRLQTAERRWPRLAALAGVAAVLGLGLDAIGDVIAVDGSDPAAGHSAAAGQDGAWAPWDPARIAGSLAEGRPVLVVFSAEWCITCKVNERVVLRDEEVVAELERLQVTVLKADWTKRDETIRVELARFGRAGVPMYLVYHPSRPESPRMLPELLSVGLVIEALREPAVLAKAEAIR